MAKQRFSETDLYLVRNWGEAMAFADAMDRVRDKHEVLLEEIGNSVHAEVAETLDVFETYFKTDGQLGFAREQWPAAQFHAGLWFTYLDLDSLATDEEDMPQAYFWVDPRRMGVDVPSAREKLWQKAPQLLTPQELDMCRRYPGRNDEDALIGWHFSSKREILDCVAAGDKVKLTKCIRDQVEIGLKLVPVLDELLRPAKGASSVPAT